MNRVKFNIDSSHLHFSIPKNISVDELESIFNQIEKLIKDKTIDEQVQEWFYQKLIEEDSYNSSIPEWVNNALDWQTGWIPILIVKQSENDWTGCLELIKSYLEAEFLQVKLSQNAMLLLVSNKYFQISHDNSLELDEFALGLYELFQNESNEEVKVGIDYPVNTVDSIVEHVSSLINDIKWVRQLWHEVSLFAPWNHQFERILSKLPTGVIDQHLMERWQIDHELLHTLEVFFEENLNMSETARRLFVHRNTLQYRIDKVKQQTGLDVKRFEDAMIVKIQLFLIYKLHKNQ